MYKPGKMTIQKQIKAIEYLCSNNTLEELRHKQSLVEQQIEQAFTQRNEEALNNLRAMEKQLQAAVIIVSGV